MEHPMLISLHPGNVLKKYDPLTAFRMLADNGIEAIQFGLGGLFFPNTDVIGHKPNVMDGSLEEIQELMLPYREAARQTGIKISQVHAPFPMYWYGDEELNARMAPIMLKSIALTAFMDCDHCIIHPGFAAKNPERFDPEKEHALNIAMYTAMIPTAKQYGVTILLENMFGRGDEGTRFAGACSDFYEAAAYVDELNALAGEKLFGFCFDTGHAHLARQNLYRAVKIMGSRIKALHIQDNAGHLDDHMIPYTGSVDWDGFLKALKEIGYKGDLNFEAPRYINRAPEALWPECLHMLGSVGRVFREELTK